MDHNVRLSTSSIFLSSTLHVPVRVFQIKPYLIHLLFTFEDIEADFYPFHFGLFSSRGGA